MARYAIDGAAHPEIKRTRQQQSRSVPVLQVRGAISFTPPYALMACVCYLTTGTNAAAEVAIISVLFTFVVILATIAFKQ